MVKAKKPIAPDQVMVFITVYYSFITDSPSPPPFPTPIPPRLHPLGGFDLTKELPLCRDCGDILGTNGKCEKCLAWGLARGAEDAHEEDPKDVLERIERWLEKWGDQLRESGNEKLARLADSLLLLIRMLRAHLDPTNPFPIRKVDLLIIIAALLYVIIIWDGIPDVYIPWGWFDDALVVMLAINRIKDTIDRFKKQED